MALSQADIEKMIAGLLKGPPTAQVDVAKVKYTPLIPPEKSHAASPGDIQLLHDIKVTLTGELAHTRLPLKEVLALAEGSVIKLNKLAGEPAEILLNGQPLATGEVVVINEVFGIRITKLLPMESEDGE